MYSLLRYTGQDGQDDSVRHLIIEFLCQRDAESPASPTRQRFFLMVGGGLNNGRVSVYCKRCGLKEEKNRSMLISLPHDYFLHS
jgi:hypothetical protein